MHSMILLGMLEKSLGLYPPYPLWNALSIVQLASVPIREMWGLGRDTIIYPPVQIIPGVVDQRWIGTLKAGHMGYDMTSLQTVPCHIAGMLALSCWMRKLFQTF